MSAGASLTPAAEAVPETLTKTGPAPLDGKIASGSTETPSSSVPMAVETPAPEPAPTPSEEKVPEPEKATAQPENPVPKSDDEAPSKEPAPEPSKTPEAPSEPAPLTETEATAPETAEAPPEQKLPDPTVAPSSEPTPEPAEPTVTEFTDEPPVLESPEPRDQTLKVPLPTLGFFTNAITSQRVFLLFLLAREGICIHTRGQGYMLRGGIQLVVAFVGVLGYFCIRLTARLQSQYTYLLV